MNSITTIIEQRIVTIVYEKEKIQVESFPQSFCDFDGWVRSRFGFSSKEKISYRNSSGNGKKTHFLKKPLSLSRHSPHPKFAFRSPLSTEIIPGASFFSKEDFIEIICKTGSEKNHAITSDPISSATSTSMEASAANFFHYYGAPCLVLLLALTMTPLSGKYIDYILIGSDVHFKATFIDCYVNFLCWSSTYLFVRRLLNPETSSSVFKKYSMDAFYGGLAAASTAFMKPIINAALHT